MRNTTKESATVVMNKIMKDINKKRVSRSKNRTIDTSFKEPKRNIKSSEGPRSRIKRLDLSRAKMLMTPPRNKFHLDSFGQTMESFKESVISRLRGCKSPIQVLKMGKVL
mmetsp:Transcript_23863/g.21204  ORF Transcript_23863/g.21204 Transcript_23863/m.21204 type:complete len:110 (-) Transcript_23863:105-434(-)